VTTPAHQIARDAHHRRVRETGGTSYQRNELARIRYRHPDAEVVGVTPDGSVMVRVREQTITIPPRR
jgi:hypothetical protein